MMPDSFRWTSLPPSDNDHAHYIMDGGRGGRGGETEKERGRESEREVAVRLFSLSPEVRWVPSLIKLIKAELEGLKAQPELVWLLGCEALTLHLRGSRAQFVRSRNSDVEQRRRAADPSETDLSSTSARGNRERRNNLEHRTQSATVTARLRLRRLIRGAAGRRRGKRQTSACIRDHDRTRI